MYTVCSHWVMNDLSVSMVRAKPACVASGADWGPFFTLHLAFCCLEPYHQGRYSSGLKDHSKRKSLWVNHFKGQYCLTSLLPLSLSYKQRHRLTRVWIKSLDSVVKKRGLTHPKSLCPPWMTLAEFVVVLFCMAQLPVNIFFSVRWKFLSTFKG